MDLRHTDDIWLSLCNLQWPLVQTTRQKDLWRAPLCKPNYGKYSLMHRLGCILNNFLTSGIDVFSLPGISTACFGRPWGWVNIGLYIMMHICHYCYQIVFSPTATFTKCRGGTVFWLPSTHCVIWHSGSKTADWLKIPSRKPTSLRPHLCPDQYPMFAFPPTGDCDGSGDGSSSLWTDTTELHISQTPLFQWALHTFGYQRAILDSHRNWNHVVNSSSWFLIQSFARSSK